MAKGNELISNLTHQTGLPEDLVSDELRDLLVKAGIRPEDVTLEELREVLAEYLQEVLLGAKAEFSKHFD